MALKEKIDKLPLSIEYNGEEYFLHIECERKKITLEYVDGVFGCLQCRISDIETKTTEKRTRITYGLTVPPEDCDDIIRCEFEIPDRFEERFIFPTKEELLKSL